MCCCVDDGEQQDRVRDLTMEPGYRSASGCEGQSNEILCAPDVLIERR